MNWSDVISLILSIITIIIALIALLQTKTQLRLSNKQQLFDRRLKNYTLFRDLFLLYKNNHDFMLSNDPSEMPDYFFTSLIDCTMLENVFAVMNKPTKQNNVKLFLGKCEMLEHAADEILLLWEEKETFLISTFIKQYRDLLRALHRQQIYVIILKKRNEKEAMTLDIVLQKQKKMAENNKLYESFNLIEKTYNSILESNIQENLKNSMKLFG